MRKLTANYIYPVSSGIIKNGIIIIDFCGKIIDVLDPEIIDYSIDDVEYYDGILVPGFINTHCHLELSWMKSMIKKGLGLNQFIIDLQKLRKDKYPSPDEINVSLKQTEKEIINEGIVAIGDIANSSLALRLKVGSQIKYHTFIEAFGFSPEIAETAFNKAFELFLIHTNIGNLSASIVPHAPYSVSKELFKKIETFSNELNKPFSIHNQESDDENQLYLAKQGQVLERLDLWGIDYNNFNATGLSSFQSIISYLPKSSPVILVHNLYTSAEDIELANFYSERIFWCLCPESNLYIQNKIPDVSLFIDLKSKVTIGTDSLASNENISILKELKTIKKYFPNVEWPVLIEWATLNGAKALGFDNFLGSFEKNKTPGINLIYDDFNKVLKIN